MSFDAGVRDGMTYEEIEVAYDHFFFFRGVVPPPPFYTLLRIRGLTL